MPQTITTLQHVSNNVVSLARESAVITFHDFCRVSHRPVSHVEHFR